MSTESDSVPRLRRWRWLRSRQIFFAVKGSSPDYGRFDEAVDDLGVDAKPVAGDAFVSVYLQQGLGGFALGAGMAVAVESRSVLVMVLKRMVSTWVIFMRRPFEDGDCGRRLQ